MPDEIPATAGEAPTEPATDAAPIPVPRDASAVVTRHSLVRRRVGFECASGRWIESKWEGVPVLDLVAAAEVPLETTHLVFESADGFRSCTPLTDLRDGLLAYDAADAHGGFPRLVAPAVIGPRAAKDVRRLHPVELAPGEDREDYEHLDFEEE